MITYLMRQKLEQKIQIPKYKITRARTKYRERPYPNFTVVPFFTCITKTKFYVSKEVIPRCTKVIFGYTKVWLDDHYSYC